MGRIIPYIMENKKCSKPPTSNGFEPQPTNMFYFHTSLDGWTTNWAARHLQGPQYVHVQMELHRQSVHMKHTYHAEYRPMLDLLKYET